MRYSVPGWFAFLVLVAIIGLSLFEFRMGYLAGLQALESPEYCPPRGLDPKRFGQPHRWKI